MARSQDILGIIRGIQTVVRAGIKEEENELRRIWSNSSVRKLLNESKDAVDKKVKTADLNSAIKSTTESAERVSMIFSGANQFVKYKVKGATGSGAKEKLN